MANKEIFLLLEREEEEPDGIRGWASLGLDRLWGFFLSDPPAINNYASSCDGKETGEGSLGSLSVDDQC